MLVHARGLRGILQESPDEGDIREEIVVSVAVGGGGGPGVLVQEVPDDGDVAGVEQVPDVAADVAVAAAAGGGGVVVVIAAQEVSNDGDVVEAEGIVATVTD